MPADQTCTTMNKYPRNCLLHTLANCDKTTRRREDPSSQFNLQLRTFILTHVGLNDYHFPFFPYVSGRVVKKEKCYFTRSR